MSNGDDKLKPEGIMSLIGNHDALEQLYLDVEVPGLYEGVMSKDDDMDIRQEFSHSTLETRVAAAYGVAPSDLTTEFLEAKIEESFKHQRVRLQELAESSGGKVVEMDEVRQQASKLDDTLKQMTDMLGSP